MKQKPFLRQWPVLFVFLFVAGPLWAQDFLAGSFWCEYRPIVSGLDYPQTDDDAARRILEEARYIFSGMIYGFSFRYTPSDIARGVAEIFELEPLHSIPWGDENFHLVRTTIDREFYRAEIRYELADFQSQRIAFWESNTKPSAAGMGEGDLFIGQEGKYNAVGEAVKQAVREHLRPRYFNKPREITGEVVLTEVPYIIIDAGCYRAKVRVKLEIEEVLPYDAY